MDIKYRSHQTIKPVVCIFLTEHRNGPIFFGTTSDCKQKLDIKPEFEYIFIDIGLSRDEMNCIKFCYGKYKNVRFVEITDWFFQKTKMLKEKERIESGLFIIWHDYLMSQKFDYKNRGYNFCAWTTEKYLDKANDVIESAKKNPGAILYRSDSDNFSNYGGFMIFNYEMITEGELFNTEKNRIQIV
jgi:hypothetical protein